LKWLKEKLVGIVKNVKPQDYVLHSIASLPQKMTLNHIIAYMKIYTHNRNGSHYIHFEQSKDCIEKSSEISVIGD